MLALGVDTSNYATSLAVVNTAKREVVCALKKMLPVPPGQTGLRQSEALFHHTLALPQMIGELGEQAALQSISSVAVSEKPRPVDGSYMPCFLAGLSFATAFAAAGGHVLHRTTHQQGHLAAALFGCGHKAQLTGQRLLFLHVSGGTTELLLTQGHEILAPVGHSLDLYAGQAIDRLGVKLGFGFPAGARLSGLAGECGDEIDPKVSVKGCDCHLSGLENQCDTLLGRGKPKAYVARYCLLAVAKTLVAMVAAARREYGPLPLLCAGGVMCSDIIRPYLEARCDGAFFAPPQLSADNAVGVALIGADNENTEGGGE